MPAKAATFTDYLNSEESLSSIFLEISKSFQEWRAGNQDYMDCAAAHGVYLKEVSDRTDLGHYVWAIND